MKKWIFAALILGIIIYKATKTVKKFDEEMEEMFV